MALDDIVQLTLTRSTVFPTRAGFGVLLLAAFHSATPNLIDAYTSVAGVAADHAINSVPYKAIVKAFSQNPRPAKVLLGKRAVGTTQVITLTPKKLTQGYKYTFNIVDYLGVSKAITYTNGASETATTISTALVTAIGTIAGVTVTSAAFVTLTASTAGRFFDLNTLPDLNELAIANTSTDPGITADMTAFYARDPSTWYGWVLDSNSKAEILAGATWTEATRKLFLCQNSDSDIANAAVSSDTASSLHAAAYARTAIMFSQIAVNNFRMFGLAAKMFTTVPGASTWDNQTIVADTPDNLNAGDQGRIRAKFCAIYTTVSALNIAQNCVLTEGEFIDLAPGTDKLYARVQEAILGLMYTKAQAGGKIPYTDSGAEEIKGTINSQLDVAIGEGFLVAGSGTVSVPKVATIDGATKATRVLPNVKFGGNLAGAIQAVQIVGTLAL